MEEFEDALICSAILQLSIDSEWSE